MSKIEACKARTVVREIAFVINAVTFDEAAEVIITALERVFPKISTSSSTSWSPLRGLRSVGKDRWMAVIEVDSRKEPWPELEELDARYDTE